MDKVLMNGPAFDGSGRKVERQVPKADVKAYEAAGYVKGGLPTSEKPIPEPKAVKITTNFDEAAEAAAREKEKKPKRK